MLLGSWSNAWDFPPAEDYKLPDTSSYIPHTIRWVADPQKILVELISDHINLEVLGYRFSEFMGSSPIANAFTTESGALFLWITLDKQKVQDCELDTTITPMVQMREQGSGI